MEFKLGDRLIGPGQPCYVIAEVGLAHDGSLALAHEYIDACSHAGVDAVKFQCHLGDTGTEWRTRKLWRNETRQEYWHRTGFTSKQWVHLWSHCSDRRVDFVCSVFSLEAFRLIDPLVNLHKVPSGRIADMPLHHAIRNTGKPVFVSNGMATFDEIRAAIEAYGKSGKVLIMDCVSEYPTSPEHIGLWSAMEGLSDHSGTIYPGIAAVALGCQVLEVHVCWSKEQGGFDTAASLDMGQLRQLVEGVRFVEKAMQRVDKNAMAKELAETRRVFMGSNA